MTYRYLSVFLHYWPLFWRVWMASLGLWLWAVSAGAQVPDSSYWYREPWERVLVGQSLLPQAAFLADDSLPGYSRIGLRYAQDQGTWRRIQAPEESTVAGLEVAGLRQQGRLTLQGSFVYAWQQDQGQQWANVADPFSGNPFIWSDPFEGRWRRHSIHTTVLAALPLGERWRVGLALDYGIGQGARNTDPRPFYRYRHLELLPSVAWRNAAGSWRAGLTVGLRDEVEENQMGFFSNNPVLLFKLKGLGAFERTPSLQADRRLAGTQTVARVHLIYQKNKQHWQLAGSWVAGAVEAQEGISAPNPGGLWYRQQWQVRAAYQLQKTQLWTLQVHTQQVLNEGEDPVFRAVSFVSEQARYGAQISWQTHRRSNPWQLAYRSHWTEHFAQDLSLQSQQTLQLWYQELGYMGQQQVLKQHLLWWELGLWHQQPLMGQWFGGQTNELSNNLYRPDFEVMNQVVSGLQSSLAFDYRRGQGQLWRVRLAYYYAQAQRTDRQQVQGSLLFFY